MAGRRRDPPHDASFAPDVAALLLGFVERTSDFVGVVDEESRVLYLNEAARKRLGVGARTDLTSADVFGPETFERYYDEIRPTLLRTGTWHGELPVRTGPGEAVPMVLTIVARIGPGGEVSGLVTHAREIDAPRDVHVPTQGYDELTGLPGRAVLDDRIRAALARSAEGREVAVIVADVDAMKDVNDSFGHDVGDDVLREVARAVSRGVRGADTVARFGNDEFVVLVDGLEPPDTPRELAERLRDAVGRAPMATRAGPIAVTASLGVAIAGPDDDPAELMARADAAMYRAKSTGSAAVAVLDHDPDTSVARVGDELAVGVSHGLIRPHVQPVVDLYRGVLVGYQGLARWEHPRRGLLEAAEFVDLVANTSILPVVDLAVLRRTAAAAARAARGGTALRAYGHVSRRLLGDVALERYLGEIVDDLGIEPSQLCIEIDHRLLARPSPTVEGALRTLREIGVRLVVSGVDGDCDVNEIVRHGFDELRLAPRLVRDAELDPTRRRVAHGTVALARALGLTVTAVGIESDAARVELRDAGCDYGEGYLFGPVQPAGEIE